jgi:hypothetical protein
MSQSALPNRTLVTGSILDGTHLGGVINSPEVIDTTSRGLASTALAISTVNYGTYGSAGRQVTKYMHRVPTNTDFTEIEVIFAEWCQAWGGESYGSGDIEIQCCLEVEDTIYRVEFNGSYVGILSAGGTLKGTIPSLVLEAGTPYAVVTDRKYTAKNNFILPYFTVDFYGEGTSSLALGANTVTDGSYSRGAKAGAVTITEGVITSVPITSGGVNYTGTVKVFATERVDGRMFSRNIGTAVVSAGAVTSVTITDGTPPSGLSEWDTPSIVFGGTFQNSNNGYGPALITGKPATPVVSAVIVGDSINASTFADTNRGEFFNGGLIPRAINGRFGMINMCQAGASADSFLMYSRMYQLVKGVVNLCVITSGTNNLGYHTAGVVKDFLISTCNNFRDLGCKVMLSTILPKTTSTDSWATVDNQTPVSYFNDNGRRDELNTFITSETHIVADYPPVLAGEFFQDSDEHSRWQTDSGALTDDGIHPNSKGRGLADIALREYFDSVTI